jgi:DNA-nicking Smr family endonuclease
MLEKVRSRIGTHKEPEVAPSDDYTRGARPLPPHSNRVPPAPRSGGPPAQSSDGVVPIFDIASEEGKIEGARAGFARRLRELSRGLLPVFDRLDLHGLSVEKAEVAVRAFCSSARGAVPRTVLIVHGKGLHSHGGQPILRDEVAHWLSSAPLARDVLCFATARPKHGGAGAMYVLLAARPAGSGLASSGRGNRTPR